MTDKTTTPYDVDLRELFDAETLARLQAIAGNHRFKLKTLIKKMILSHIDEWDPETFEEDPDEIVEAKLRIGLREAFRGEGVDAHIVLAEIEEFFRPDADDD